MSANIFGERFLGRREPAWHKLGIVFDLPLTATEAAMRASLDYQVIKRPIYIQEPDTSRLVEVPDLVAIAREPVEDDNHWRVFGTASPRWEPIQNLEIARGLDGLVGMWPLETAGAIGQGETVFFTLDAGSAWVKEDQLQSYFLVTDTKKPGHALQIAFTPVRVVCQNTLVSGLSAATVNVSLTHSRGLQTAYQVFVDLIPRLERAKAGTLDIMEKMAGLRLVKEQIDEILSKAYPEPKAPDAVRVFERAQEAGLELDQEAKAIREQAAVSYGSQLSLQKRLRAGAQELLARFNDMQPVLANTGWAVYNAIVETEDWRESKGDIERSALFGDGARTKARAFAAVTSLL